MSVKNASISSFRIRSIQPNHTMVDSHLLNNELVLSLIEKTSAFALLEQVARHLATLRAMEREHAPKLKRSMICLLLSKGHGKKCYKG